MIDYDFGKWGIGFIFKMHGSVCPKAFAWSLPAAAFSLSLHLIGSYQGLPFVRDFDNRELSSGYTSLWSGYTFILGFLLVFRTQIAYSRFWEGASTLQQVKGAWINAARELIAFSTPNPDLAGEVLAFQHLMVRLMSMLHCAALQEVADMQDEQFEILGNEGIDDDCLAFLGESDKKSELLMAWLQRLIVQNIGNGVVPIAPPILSRVFHELSNGIVDVQNAKKIGEFLFPFPYAQMISFFLLLHWILTPFMVFFLVNNPAWSAVVSFSTVFAMWSVNYIAAEIEMPFGDDPNDLPISMLQIDFNNCLRLLMDPLAKEPPEFAYQARFHDGLRSMPARFSLLCSIRQVDSNTLDKGSFDSDGAGQDDDDEDRSTPRSQRSSPRNTDIDNNKRSMIGVAAKRQTMCADIHSASTGGRTKAITSSPGRVVISDMAEDSDMAVRAWSPGVERLAQPDDTGHGQKPRIIAARSLESSSGKAGANSEPSTPRSRGSSNQRVRINIDVDEPDMHRDSRLIPNASHQGGIGAVSSTAPMPPLLLQGAPKAEDGANGVRLGYYSPRAMHSREAVPISPPSTKLPENRLARLREAGPFAPPQTPVPDKRLVREYILPEIIEASKVSQHL